MDHRAIFFGFVLFIFIVLFVVVVVVMIEHWADISSYTGLLRPQKTELQKALLTVYGAVFWRCRGDAFVIPVTMDTIGMSPAQPFACT